MGVLLTTSSLASQKLNPTPLACVKTFMSSLLTEWYHLSMFLILLTWIWHWKITQSHKHFNLLNQIQNSFLIKFFLFIFRQMMGNNFSILSNFSVIQSPLAWITKLNIAVLFLDHISGKKRQGKGVQRDLIRLFVFSTSRCSKGGR